MTRLSNYFAGALVAALMFALATPSFADTVTGTVRSVNTDRNEIVLKGVLKDTTYQLDKNPWIVLDGRKCKLTDLREGDKATVEYTEKGGNMIASSARVLRNASETSGITRFVIADKMQIVLKGVVKDTPYQLVKNATILFNGKEGKFSDLREGDQITLTYERSGDQFVAHDVRVLRK
jgi:hypothetical protein